MVYPGRIYCSPWANFYAITALDAFFRINGRFPHLMDFDFSSPVKTAYAKMFDGAAKPGGRMSFSMRDDYHRIRLCDTGGDRNTVKNIPIDLYLSSISTP